MSLKRSKGTVPAIGSKIAAVAMDDLSDVSLATETHGDRLRYEVSGGDTVVPTGATAKSSYFSNTPDKSYDGSGATFWEANEVTGSWIRYDFGTSISLDGMTLSQTSSSNECYTMSVEGSDNDSDWTLVDGEITLSAGANSPSWNAATWRYWRLTKLTGDATYWRVYEVTFADLVVSLWRNVGAGVFDQDDTAGALPVLTLTQADVDEDYIKIIGTSDTSADRALVDAANFTTPGSIVGWLKIAVVDEQGTAPITDGDYYIPFYSAPTA